MTEEVCELVVTAPDADWLIEFTRRPIRSIYEWEGQLYDRTESRAAIHTRTSLVPRIIDRLDREHPYDVPGVFALPIVQTSAPYREWILQQTTAG